MPSATSSVKKSTPEKTLEKKTRRTLPEWIALLQAKGPKQKKEQTAWLQVKFGLNDTLAKFIVKELHRQQQPDFSGDLNRMFKGDKRFLRPVYEKLIHRINGWPGLSLRINHTYLSLRNSRQFATLRVTKEGLILSVKKCAGLSIKGKNVTRATENVNGSVRYRITLLDESDVSDELLRMLKACYKAM